MLLYLTNLITLNLIFTINEYCSLIIIPVFCTKDNSELNFYKFLCFTNYIYRQNNFEIIRHFAAYISFICRVDSCFIHRGISVHTYIAT